MRNKWVLDMQNIRNNVDSIQAIHKFLGKNGKKIIGVYVVIEDETKFNQQDFANAIRQVTEMSEKMPNI